MLFRSCDFTLLIVNFTAIKLSGTCILDLTFPKSLPKRCKLWITLQVNTHTHPMYTACKIAKSKLGDELHNGESSSSLDRARLGSKLRLLAVDL